MWEKVDLFSDGKKYIVFTNGIEEWKHIYASVMVFDENEIDLLSDNSKEKEKLTNFFAESIKNLNTKEKFFYELYWKMVDPDHLKLWLDIKKNNISPSIRDIAKGLNLKSVSNIDRYVYRLQDKNYIAKTPYIKRSIVILKEIICG